MIPDCSPSERARHRGVSLQISEGTVSADEVKAIHQNVTNELEAAFEAAKNYEGTKRDWLASFWYRSRRPAPAPAPAPALARGEAPHSRGADKS